MDTAQTHKSPTTSQEVRSENFRKMNGKGKKRERNHATGDDISTPKKLPRNESKTEDGNSDEIVVCQISEKRRVSVKIYKGQVMVDIHEFYVKDGKKLHGKRGISLSMKQWKVLRDHLVEIDLALKENS